MGSLLTLLSLSTVMAIASFLAGSLPLALTLSQSQLRLISTIGMGVLVGTSLIVIIPEGVDTLYESTSTVHHRRDLTHYNALDVRWAQPTALLHKWQISTRGFEDDDISPFDMPGPVVPDNLKDPPTTPTKPGVVGALSLEEDAENTHDEQEKDKHTDSPHAWVGIALISGFILMYLIDKLPQYTGPSKPKTRTHHIALNNLGRRFNLTTSLDREEEANSFLEANQTDDSRNRGFATTTGLVIHAAADGIALGASSATADTELSLIIFFAVTLHKGPAAMALTTLLLKQGLSKRTARAHLLLFSLAAPFGAILTWVVAHLLGGFRGRSTEGTTFWTGMLLLFSGGTFLYVAMHAMQETSKSHQQLHGAGNANGYIEGARDGPPAEPKASLRDLGAACFGMILPLFLQIGHAH